MVVTRKTPVAPAPPASRTTSSQPLPRAMKPKSSPVNGDTHPSTPLAPKPTKRPKKKRRSFASRLYILVLSLFTVYALTTCRTSTSPPICKALYFYHTHVLEPYIIPPLNSVIHHPAFAPIHPYLDALHTYEKHAIKPRLALLAAYSRHKFSTHILPAYNRYITRALWHARILPAYTKHIHPYLSPLISYYTTYAPRVSASLHSAYTRLVPLYHRAKPLVSAFARAVYTYSLRAYEEARPRAVHVYLSAKPHLAALYMRARESAGKVVRGARDKRRMYVDPHVRRVWEKIAERETGRTGGEQEEPAVEESFQVVQETLLPIHTPTPSPFPEESTRPAEPLTTTSSDAPSEEASSPPEPEPEAPLRYEAGVPEVPAHSATVSVPEPIADPEPEPTQTPAAEPEQPQEEDAQSQLQSQEQERQRLQQQQEIEDFLKQLGLDETVASSASSDPIPDSPAPDTNTNADPDPDPGSPDAAESARLKTLTKRQDITSRHTRWQAELDRAVSAADTRLRSVLRGMREGAVRELGVMYGGEGVKRKMEGEGRGFVKGLEGVLGGMREKSKGKEGEGEGERERWEKVVRRVEEKFMEKVDGVQREVGEWYAGVREREGWEIQRAAAEVRSLAEKAQADIGLDYAWLEDVTYSDWQRYHDLMRTSESFAIHIQKLQNGTYEAEFPDTLATALGALQEELEGVVRAFISDVERVRREGEVVLEEAEREALEEEEEQQNEEEPRLSILPVEPTHPAEETSEPRVSILPIEPEPEREGMTEEEKMHMFVGRSKEEVERRLREARVHVERVMGEL